MPVPSRFPFRDRTEAGQALAAHLRAYADRPDVLVLALPRGGVPVAFEVASVLNVPLDIFLVRKLGVPGHEELAMGAIASGGVRVLNDDVLHALSLRMDAIDRVAAREAEEIVRREREYRGSRPPVHISGRTVILIDDGLATGATMRAAAKAVQAQQPARVIVAVPVAARDTCRELKKVVDEVVCGMMPEPFYAVGLWYEDFAQTSDDEVRSLLARHEQTRAASRANDD